MHQTMRLSCYQRIIVRECPKGIHCPSWEVFASIERFLDKAKGEKGEKNDETLIPRHQGSFFSEPKNEPDLYPCQKCLSSSPVQPTAKSSGSHLFSYSPHRH